VHRPAPLPHQPLSVNSLTASCTSAAVLTLPTRPFFHPSNARLTPATTPSPRLSTRDCLFARSFFLLDATSSLDPDLVSFCALLVLSTPLQTYKMRSAPLSGDVALRFVIVSLSRLLSYTLRLKPSSRRSVLPPTPPPSMVERRFPPLLPFCA